MVYTFDRTLGLIKIVKHGSRYCVYRLKTIKWRMKHFKDPMKLSEKKHAFEWEEKPIKTWSFKPYEDKDVSDSPQVYIEDVRQWENHKISYDPFA